MSRATRRLVAWIAAFALVAGTLLPTHVLGHALRAAPFGNDFCTANPDGSPARGLPSTPATEHACAGCSTCTVPGVALVDTTAAATLPAPPTIAAIVAPRATRTFAAHGGNARAPPALS